MRVRFVQFWSNCQCPEMSRPGGYVLKSRDTSDEARQVSVWEA